MTPFGATFTDIERLRLLRTIAVGVIAVLVVIVALLVITRPEGGPSEEELRQARQDCEVELAAVKSAIRATEASNATPGNEDTPAAFLGEGEPRYYTWSGEYPGPWLLLPVGQPPCS